MSDLKLDNLIDELSDELEPVKPMAHPLLRLLPWLVLALLYMSVCVSLIGVRPDLIHKVEDPFFLFEVFIMSSVSLSAAICAVWMCVPDVRGQKWMLSMPFVLFGIFVIWSSIRSFTEGMAMPDPHWDQCFEDATFIALVPTAAIIYLTRRGKTTRPLLMGLMNITAVGALAYVGLRFTCMIDTVGQSAVYHLLPFLVFGTVMGLVARKVFNW